jgi:hypothetical protein
MLCIVLVLSFLPCFVCGRAPILSETEQKYMIEQAINGNTTAMGSLGLHYHFTDRTANKASILYEFYLYEQTKIWNILSDNEYSEVLKQAEEDEKAKEKIRLHKLALNMKQNLYNRLDNNLSLMQNFLNDCSSDDFCKSSDIYEYYSQKVKNMSENKTK